MKIKKMKKNKRFKKSKHVQLKALKIIFAAQEILYINKSSRKLMRNQNKIFKA